MHAQSRPLRADHPDVLQFNAPQAADAATDRTGGGLTVGEFFERYKLPELIEAGRASDTIREYRRYVARWQAWQEEQRISYPLLITREVSRADLLDWRNWIISADGLDLKSNRTANKHIGVLQSILNTAAERGAHNNPPRLRPLDAKAAARKTYLTYDQIDSIYNACDAATWPRVQPGGLAPLPFSPPVYWRAFVVLQFNYGFRTQELASYESAADAITWRQIWWEAETPAPEGNAQNSHGWLHYVPTKQKRLKPESLVLPLNETAARHLRSIETPGGADPGARVFPFPYCNREFYDCWKSIIKASGVELKPDLKTGERPPVLIKLFRKTCETWHDTHSPGMGEIITGHAERSVSGRHYANREMRLIEAINRMPQPSSFGP